MSSGSASAIGEPLAPRRRPVIGLVWRVGAWLAVLAGFLLILYLLEKFLPPMDSGAFRAGLRGAIGCGLAAVIYQTGRAIAMRGRQLRAETASAVMARDPRVPILYFRSFKDDKFSYFNLSSSFEEILASVFSDAGPVIAIGRPDESLPPIGAARLHIGNDQWQGLVKELLDQAAIAIIRPGVSPGVLWEVRTAVQFIPPERLLIAIPLEPSKRGRATREDAYAAFRNLVNDCFRVPLPATIGEASFIGFCADWTPYVLNKVSSNVVQYLPLRAFRRALKPFFEHLGIPVRKRIWEVSPPAMALIVICVLSQFINLAGPQWKPLAPSGAQFTAALPGVAEPSQQRVPSPAGELVVHLASAHWKAAEYNATYVDYPDAVLQSGTTDELLDHARDGALTGMKAQVLRETHITVDGHPGRELIAEMKAAKSVMKCRFVLAGRELVMLMAALPDDEEDPFQNSTDVQKFFDSLHIKQ